jgi:hypothetical protein
MQLMVMQSNAIVCGRDLRQPYRDEKRIRLPSCAGVVSGNLTWSCSMRSNALVCWRGLVKRIACRQAFERHRVPLDLRQRDLVLPVHRPISPAAQQALAADGASRPRDQGFLKPGFGLTDFSI